MDRTKRKRNYSNRFSKFAGGSWIDGRNWTNFFKTSRRPCSSLTFRTDKHHKVQESNKSSKNILKLASKLQHFIDTGRATKSDLKAIDEVFRSLLIDQGRRGLQMLEQLQEHVPKSKGKDSLDEACSKWSRWVSSIESAEKEFPAGYANVDPSKIGYQNVLLEEAVDYDSDISRMLVAFNSALADSLRKSSYQIPDGEEINEGASEIIELFNVREKILLKASSEQPAAHRQQQQQQAQE